MCAINHDYALLFSGLRSYQLLVLDKRFGERLPHKLQGSRLFVSEASFG